MHDIAGFKTFIQNLAQEVTAKEKWTYTHLESGCFLTSSLISHTELERTVASKALDF